MAVVRGRSSEDAIVPAYLSAGRRPYGVSQDTRASELTGQQHEAQLKLALTYPAGQCWLLIALGAFLASASSSALAQTPAAQRGLTFVRGHCASCHR
jgi:hypothetical protein